MDVRAASRAAWTAATIAMPDGLTGAVTNRAAPFLLYGAYTVGRRGPASFVASPLTAIEQ